MARTLSLTSAELPREVRCRLRAGPKSVVFVFCVFPFALFPLWVLGDWEPGILHGPSVQLPSGEHIGVIHPEFTHEDAGGLGRGIQGGRETPECKDRCGPGAELELLSASGSLALGNQQPLLSPGLTPGVQEDSAQSCPKAVGIQGGGWRGRQFC